MKTIWKFPLGLKEHQTIALPKGAKILTIQIQQGSPMIWAEVEPANDSEVRRFWIVGTGNYLPEGKTYVGTIQMGGYVWHVYEGK